MNSLQPQNPSLRWRLGLLVTATMLPLILFSSGVVYFNHMQRREAAFDRVLEVVRGVRLVLDTEMQGVTLALEVLGASRALQRGDMEAFRENTAAFLRRYPNQGVSLALRDGQQLFNSRVPAGQPLPRRRNLTGIEQVFATGKPVYSDLFTGSVSGQNLVAVGVPVFRDGKVVYELSFDPPLALFQRILTQQQPNAGWTMSIFDGKGINFARLPNPNETIGRAASPTLLPALLSTNEGKLNTYSLEGVQLNTAFTRSALTDWRVAAGTPVRELTAPLVRELTITVAVGVAFLVVGLFFAIGMATRIARGEMLHELLINELNHRVKNTLATVQSIAAQTLRRADNPGDAIDKLSARLVSLGRTHNVLSDQKWESAQVGDLVDGALAPYAGRDGGRVQAAGPELRLSPRAALAVAMALHELATNAAKYGALSNERGKVLIDWSADGAGHFRLTWREVGGPPVAPPGRAGFGTRLIDGGMQQIGGSATLAYDPGGVVCTLVCPTS